MSPERMERLSRELRVLKDSLPGLRYQKVCANRNKNHEEADQLKKDIKARMNRVRAINMKLAKGLG